MKEISQSLAKLLVVILVLIQLPAFFLSKFNLWAAPYDDAYRYQIFVESFLRGKLNFSLGGFQGASLPAIPLYFLFPTPQAYSLVNFAFAVLTIPLIYLLSKKLYHSELSGVLAALLYALMPFIIFSPFSGYPQGVFHFLTILTAILVLNKNFWVFIIFGWSLITKPFSFALLPFFIFKNIPKQFLLGSLLGLVYLFILFLSSGQMQIGVHPGVTPFNVIHLDRFVYNLATLPPLIFSLHNYLLFSKTTTVADVIHTYPLIIIFSIIVLTNHQQYFANKKLFLTLASFYLFSLVIPLFLSYVDTNYLETFYLAAILLSLPFLKKNPLLLNLTIATIGYQFIYIYVRYQNFWTFNGFFLFTIGAVGLIIGLYLSVRRLVISP